MWIENTGFRDHFMFFFHNYQSHKLHSSFYRTFFSRKILPTWLPLLVFSHILYLIASGEVKDAEQEFQLFVEFLQLTIYISLFVIKFLVNILIVSV